MSVFLFKKKWNLHPLGRLKTKEGAKKSLGEAFEAGGDMGIVLEGLSMEDLCDLMCGDPEPEEDEGWEEEVDHLAWGVFHMTNGGLKFTRK